jgi:Asp-tRNA(Asn)/Glu-tRNA(Gln) amidotransferase B subunit
MKKTKGRANPQLANKLLKERIETASSGAKG